MKEADRTEHMLPMVQHAHKATHEGEWTRWQFWSNQAELYNGAHMQMLVRSPHASNLSVHIHSIFKHLWHSGFSGKC